MSVTTNNFSSPKKFSFMYYKHCFILMGIKFSSMKQEQKHHKIIVRFTLKSVSKKNKEQCIRAIAINTLKASIFQFYFSLDLGCRPPS